MYELFTDEFREIPTGQPFRLGGGGNGGYSTDDFIYAVDHHSAERSPLIVRKDTWELVDIPSQANAASTAIRGDDRGVYMATNSGNLIVLSKPNFDFVVNLPVGRGLMDVAIDGDFIYMLEIGLASVVDNARIFKIDISGTPEVVGSVVVGQHKNRRNWLNQLEVLNGVAYTISHSDGILRSWDLEKMELKEEHGYVHNSVGGISIDEEGKFIYASSGNSGAVFAFNLETNELVEGVPSVSTNGMSITNDRTHIYVSHDNVNVSCIRKSDMRLVGGPFSIGNSVCIHGHNIWNDKYFLYISHRGQGPVTIIDKYALHRGESGIL